MAIFWTERCSSLIMTGSLSFHRLSFDGAKTTTTLTIKFAEITFKCNREDTPQETQNSNFSGQENCSADPSEEFSSGLPDQKWVTFLYSHYGQLAMSGTACEYNSCPRAGGSWVMMSTDNSAYQNLWGRVGVLLLK